MNPPKNPRPLAAYLRVSTAEQAASGLGIAAQRTAIIAAAEQQGLPIGAWYDDAGKSGAKMRNRPGLQAALAEIRSGRLGGLVVAKIDRLGRSYEVMTLVGDAAREGWRLVALDVGLDTTTAEGELVAGALTMAARFEWRRISQRQREKFTELRREGRPRGHAAAGPELAARIASMRATGLSLRAIAATLNDDGVPTIQGGSEWRASSVRSALIAHERDIEAQAG
jgi:DNA invertase Pin-like site-specific DNA recombinase